MIVRVLKGLVCDQKTFEEVLFWGILLLAGCAAFVSVLFALLSGMDASTILYNIVATFLFVTLALVAKWTNKISACYFVMCFLVNTMILPLCFFFSGGFKCGITLYCLMGVMLCSLYTRRRARIFLIVVSIVSYETAFVLSWFFPYLVYDIPPKIAFIDECLSFVIMALALYAVVVFLMYVYNAERQKSEELIKKLDFYSKRDPLTSLFNRRYFIKYLEQMIWPNGKGFYLLMFDIDNFKRVNDVFGHPFGDKVLCEVAKETQSLCRLNRGECSVRYGGEEFLQLIYADSYEEARTRAELVRLKISNIKFEKYPDVQITVSGGFVECSSSQFEHQNKMLCAVDELLYEAKKRGKNQICDRV